ncbi:MAG: hypothetical protein ACRDA4_02150 [Filifactoraceae bacterium]
MVKFLIGEAGSGKTKQMIENANKAIENVKGEVVYIEVSSKHMLQLHRNIRFVSTEDYSMDSLNSIYGFICGLLSSNYDIEKIYVDGLDKITGPIDDMVIEFIEHIEKVAKRREVEVTISANVEDCSVIEKLSAYNF